MFPGKAEGLKKPGTRERGCCKMFLPKRMHKKTGPQLSFKIMLPGKAEGLKKYRTQARGCCKMSLPKRIHKKTGPQRKEDLFL